MGVYIDKEGPVWTVVHNRPEARNVMQLCLRPVSIGKYIGIDGNHELSKTA